MPAYTLAELKADVAAGSIDTVLVAFPDMQGRLIGKRFQAEFFLSSAVDETHGCDYLLADDIDIEPVPGYEAASWERGYGDFVMRPDLATLMKNLRMAENVAAALSVKPVAHFIYLSSDAVYDWRHPLISEATAPSPTDLYSTMHLAREQVLAATTATIKVPYAILRPCAVYGPGDTHNSYGPNRFARTALAEGKIRLFGAGEETRDHVCIDDVVGIIALTLAHRSTGVLNVVSGRSATFAEVAAQVAALCPQPVAVESQPQGSPVTHRHFDATALRRAFPAHRSLALATGLGPLLASLRGGPAR